jgi:hypothetical protein
MRFCPVGCESDPRPALAMFTSMLISGKVNADISPFLGGARLVPLQKKDGGIRPIAVGCTWRRLAAKVLIRLHHTDFKDFFEPLQLGVGTSKGAEAIVHATQRLSDLNFKNEDFVIFQADFHNAFNLIDRSVFIQEVKTHFPKLSPFVEWCYCNPSNLYVPAGGSVLSQRILSVNGTQQGDPLGPFLFSIALHCLLRLIVDKVPNLSLNGWYMDDGTIAGNRSQISSVINLITKFGPSLGLHLNLKKSVLFSPSSSPIDAPLFSIDIGRATAGGITTLGCPIGSSDFVTNFFTKKLEKISCALQKLTSIKNSHIALSILLKCVAFCKFSFYIRVISSVIFHSFCKKFDRLVLDTLQKIVGVLFTPFAFEQAALPLSLGGLGLRSTFAHGPAAYISSFNGVQDMLLKLLPSIDKSILFDESVFSYSKQLLLSNIDPSSDIDLLMHTTSQKQISQPIDEFSLKQFLEKISQMDQARLFALRDSPQALLFDVPLAKARGFVLSPHVLRFLVCSRLGIPALCNEGDMCFQCSTPMDSLGYHMAVCQKAGSFILRHNALRDIIFKFCQSAAMSPIVEHHCFSSQPGLRADVFLPTGGFLGSCGVALDVTVIYPLQDSILPKSSVASLQGCSLGEAVKHAKYEKFCAEDNISLIPLAVEFFGCWGNEASLFFKHLAKHVACRFNNSVSDTLLQLYRQLSVCLVRYNAIAVLKRLPSVPD